MFQSVNRPMPFWTGVVAGISKAHRVFLHASGTMGGWVRPARSQQRQGISIVNVLVQAYPNGADAGKGVVPVPVDCLVARSPSKSSEGLTRVRPASRLQYAITPHTSSFALLGSEVVVEEHLGNS